MSKKPSVCIGINKIPIRSVGEVSIAFKIGSPARVFRSRFLIIENLIHPIVLGLPFLRENRAVLSFERDELYFGQTVAPLRQIGPPPKPPPLHVAAFESVTLKPWSRNWIRVYLTGTGRLAEEIGTVQNLYVRPFSAETNVDVPQIAAHTVIDTSEPTCLVEVMNVWPHPINIHRNTPVGLVDTINPEIVEVPAGTVDQSRTAERDPDETEYKTPVPSAQVLSSVFPAGPVPAQADPREEVPTSKQAPPVVTPESGGKDRRDDAESTPHTAAFSDVPLSSCSCKSSSKGIEVEDIEEDPLDESFPVNNGDVEGDAILEGVDKLFGATDAAKDDDPVPGLVDEEDDVKERGKSKNPFELNTSGLVFSEKNRAKFLISATAISTSFRLPRRIWEKQIWSIMRSN